MPTKIFRMLGVMVMFTHEAGRLENLSHLQEQPWDGRYDEFDDICTYINIIVLAKLHIEETCGTYGAARF